MVQMIIANRLSDGLVVFLAESGGWVESIDAGKAIEEAGEAERLFEASQEDERRCVIIDPNLIEVSRTDGRWVPVVYREAIRAFGPSVKTEELEPNRS